MSETFSTALILMLVGMITVFAMLVIVYLVGNLIITITNKLYKEVPVNQTPVTPPVNIESPKLAAIITAVNMVTLGKGKVTSIRKI